MNPSVSNQPAAQSAVRVQLKLSKLHVQLKASKQRIQWRPQNKEEKKSQGWVCEGALSKY